MDVTTLKKYFLLIWMVITALLVRILLSMENGLVQKRRKRKRKNNMNHDWKFYTDIDFNDESVKMYSIDTRDFHCAVMTEAVEPDKEDFDLKKLIKYPDRFFFTADEVVETLARLYNESGGKKEWRMLSLTGDGERYTANWQIKYIRIHRTEHGLLMCNNHHYALNKEIWRCKAEIPYGGG